MGVDIGFGKGKKNLNPSMLVEGVIEYERCEGSEVEVEMAQPIRASVKLAGQACRRGPFEHLIDFRIGASSLRTTAYLSSPPCVLSLPRWALPSGAGPSTRYPSLA